MKKLGKGCLIIVGIVVLLAVVGVMIGGGSRQQSAGTGGTNAAPASATAPAQKGAAQAAAAEPTSAPEPTSVPEPTAVAYTVGQDVQVDEVRWKILQAEDLGQTVKSDNQFIKDLNTAGRFVRVRLEVENLSKDMLTFAGVDLKDDQGRTFKSSSDAIMLIPSEEQCVLVNLNPNVAKTCTMIYEIPQNAQHLRMEVGDLKILGNKSELIDLGLE